MASTNRGVTQADIDYFTSAGISVVHSNEQLGGTYNTDYFDKYHGASQTIVFPKSTSQVSTILSHCNNSHISVVTQGGNSGTAGGAMAQQHELLLSLRDMDRIRDLDIVSGVVVAEAGCILETLDEHVRKFEYIVPVDLGAKKRCMIGGNVSTNAGGLRYLRYGSLHGNVLGLEVVLPDGQVLDSLFTLKKDASGYDVKQLFIGAEGTLGVVTAVSLALAPKPQSEQLVVLGMDAFVTIQRTFVLARQLLGEIVSAFEFWERRCNELVVQYEGYSSPLSATHEFHVLIETRGSLARHDWEKMDLFLARLRAEQLVGESRVVRDPAEMEQVWLFRSQMANAHMKSGCMHVYDFSLASKHQHELLRAVKAHLHRHKLYGCEQAAVRDVTFFGHVGDDNIHLQVIADEFGGAVEEAMEPWVYQWVGAHKGSVAAEHGLGAHKGQFLKYSKSPALVDTMKALKRLLDPNDIMNPGKHVARA
ncbi:D-lactate ferricytochrome c oxidoreductase [Kickxella alabastrina]|uniref:D-lactate ferricytochrome c oxidoreductase n=1 Tax=Kickxella alabastrina TaxID=61397 RepID=A0ACC1IHT4_9FUNG|nr:D-lactate ferricytochrome c oxidoreductase [Kickxella alabastrina]